MTLRTLLVSSLFTAAAFAGSPSPIGVVTASGHFTLEGSRIWGNSTLFDGAKIETTDASSELSLSNGVRVQLAAGSIARVWKNRLELEHGSGQVTSASSFALTAGELRVEGARYRVQTDARMEVAALSGAARVLNTRGSLIATVPAGRNMSFAMQQSATREGCLVYKGTGYILQSDDPMEVVQLSGTNLIANVGNRVIVSGPMQPTGATITPATSTMNVTVITTRARGGCLTVAAALGAQTQVSGTPAPAATPTPTANTPTTPATPKPAPGPTVAKSGMSTGAKVAIIGGIAGGGRRRGVCA
ncbi:MAG: hypothetical protein WDO18_18010 [Acidobacteriota bacterium]